jgi:predicted DNA-binding transcriptional regulator YafY
MLPVLLSHIAARSALASAEPPDADGWVRLTLPIESSMHAPVELLRFGADAEVISPPELREEIATAARGLVEIYRGNTAPTMIGQVSEGVPSSATPG